MPQVDPLRDPVLSTMHARYQENNIYMYMYMYMQPAASIITCT